MTNVRNRTKLLKKLAQTTSGTTTPPQQTIPAPPPFQASSVYPGIRQGFNAASVSAIDNLVSTLNTALQYASNGTINFQTLKNNNFSFDISASPSVDQKNLLMFSQMVYRTLLNNGNAFKQPLTGQQIAEMVNTLMQSQPLNALSQTNPAGPLARQIPGNMKTNLQAYLQYLVNANPVTQR